MPKLSHQNAPYLLPIILSVPFLFGAGLAGAGVWHLVRGLRCESWPTTEGVIDRAEMKFHSSSKGSGSYSADIFYHYKVAGRYYTSWRLAFGAMNGSESDAQDLLYRFPIHAKVPVHYSPDDPALAVLETGIHRATWACFGGGALFTFIGVLVFRAVRKALWPRRNAAFNLLLGLIPFISGFFGSF